MRISWVVIALAASVIGASLAYAEEPTTWGKVVTKTATQAGNAADQDLWDPAADTSIVLMGCLFSSSAPATVELEVSNVDVVPPQVLESAGWRQVGYGTFPLYHGATDAVLTYTTTNNSGTVAIMCSGYEKPAGF